MSNNGSSSLLSRDDHSSSGVSLQTVRAVIGGISLVAILVFGLPWIGEYMRLSRDVAEMNALHSQLDDVQSRKEKFTAIESILRQDLTEAKARSITPTEIEQVREELVAIVRESNASLRRLEIGENIVRPWGISNDDPQKDTSPGFGMESRFVLHKQTIQLQADGSLDSAAKILDKAKERNWLMTTKSLTLAPNSVRESPVTIEVQWILFGLEDAPVEEFDDAFEGEEFAAKPSPNEIR